MSEKPCEVCAGAQTILVADELVTDAEGAYRWTKTRVPCPECTEAGRRWSEEEAAAAERSRWMQAGAVVIHVDYHGSE